MEALMVFLFAGFGFLCAVSIPFLMKLPAVKRKYKSMDKTQLMQANTFAKKLLNIFFLLAVVAPIPFFLLIQVISNKLIIKLLLCLAFLVSQAGVIGGALSWVVKGITKRELKCYRPN